MFDYVIVMPKATGAATPAPRGAQWTPVHSSPTASVWVAADGPAAWRGAALRDGYRVGMAVEPVATAETVAQTWGPYILLRMTAAGHPAVFREPSGRVPAYWADAGDRYVVASDIRPILDALPNAPSPDWSYLALVAAGHYLPARRTGFDEIRELIPGEEAEFRPGEVALRSRWRPSDFYRRPLRSAAEAEAGLKAAARRSADFWASQYEHLLLHLSGGLDSSSVLGLLATSPARPRITCVNFLVGHAESDEREFAAASVAMHGAPLVERLIDEDSATMGRVQGLPARPTTRLLGQGFGDASLDVARQVGAQAYVTGRGGDHVFYCHVPSLAAQDYLAATWNPVGWLGHAYAAARHTGKPLAWVLKEAWTPRDKGRVAHDLMRHANAFVPLEALDAAEVAAHLHPWISAALDDAPAGKVEQIVHLVELQRHYDRIGAALQIDEVHPFISQPMFEASLAVPSYRFAPDSVERGLQRAVFRDLIPRTVYERREKGATTSHALRVFRRRLGFIREALLEGELASRGLLDRARLERSLTPTGLMDGRAGADMRSALVTELWLRASRAYLAEAGDSSVRVRRSAMT